MTKKSTFSLLHPITFNFEKALKFIRKGKKVWRVEWRNDKKIKDKTCIGLNKEGDGLSFFIGRNIMEINIGGSDLFKNDWYIVK